MTIDVFDKKRGVLQISLPDGVGDSAEFTLKDNGELYINLDEPWAGDTESGFGRSCSVTIPKDDVDALRKLLSK